MKNNRRLNVVTLLFILVMIFFTVFSNVLYELTLPKVLTGRVTEKPFPASVTTDDGMQFNTTSRMKAIPVTALHGNSVFILEEREDGIYAIPAELEIGEMKDGWVSFEEGLSSGVKIIIGSDRKLEAGMKVLEVPDEKQKKSK